MMATDQQVATLRPMIDEPDSTTYSDEILKTLIDQVEDDLDTAAAQIWEQKAARFSTLVDVSESGSSRSMSQLYKNAAAQATYYAKKISDAEVVIETTQRARTRTAVRL
jgi:hypothetical protein